MRKRILRFLKCIFIPLFVIGVLLFYIVSLQNTTYENSEKLGSTLEDTVASSVQQTVDTVVAETPFVTLQSGGTEKPSFQMTVLDVGQASCTLFESNGEYMVFDGGDKETSSKVVAVCKEKGITHIKYLVASHFHSDHVYGIVGLIKAGITFDYLVVPDYETDSYAKTALMQLVDGSKVLVPYVGQQFLIGDIKATCICPVTEEYSDDNGYSVGFIFLYDGIKILLNGDATQESEVDMLSEEVDVAADILIVPHHGSTYSSSREWLSEVKPSAAIVSCGKDNEYFHPHEGVLQRLSEAGLEKESLYRTDLQGDIVVSVLNGVYQIVPEKEVTQELLWVPGKGKEKVEGAYSDIWDAKTDVVESYYIGNKYSKKFHRPSCNQLPREDRRVLISDRETALQGGYMPCGNCGP